MRKLLIKITIKLLNYLASKINVDFDNDTVNDLCELAAKLQAKLDNLETETTVTQAE